MQKLNNNEKCINDKMCNINLGLNCQFGMCSCYKGNKWSDKFRQCLENKMFFSNSIFDVLEKNTIEEDKIIISSQQNPINKKHQNFFFLFVYHIIIFVYWFFILLLF